MTNGTTMISIGLIGCGNIATIIAEKSKNVSIVAIYDADTRRMEAYSSRWGAPTCKSVKELLSHPCELVVEAASPAAVRATAKEVLSSGKSLMVMSVGGLVDASYRKELCDIAEKTGAKIYVPSGAIGGIDALRAARVGSVSSIELETRKPPASLGIEVSHETTVFEGSPSEAIALYPHNINVAVTLALAGGEDVVRVRIVADPCVDKNIHTIRVIGDVGALSFRFENEQSPNKATSLIAGYSAVALLEKIASPLQM